MSLLEARPKTRFIWTESDARNIVEKLTTVKSEIEKGIKRITSADPAYWEAFARDIASQVESDPAEVEKLVSRAMIGFAEGDKKKTVPSIPTALVTHTTNKLELHVAKAWRIDRFVAKSGEWHLSETEYKKECAKAVKKGLPKPKRETNYDYWSRKNLEWGKRVAKERGVPHTDDDDGTNESQNTLFNLVLSTGIWELIPNQVGLWYEGDRNDDDDTGDIEAYVAEAYNKEMKGFIKKYREKFGRDVSYSGKGRKQFKEGQQFRPSMRAESDPKSPEPEGHIDFDGDYVNGGIKVGGIKGLIENEKERAEGIFNRLSRTRKPEPVPGKSGRYRVAVETGFDIHTDEESARRIQGWENHLDSTETLWKADFLLTMVDRIAKWGDSLTPEEQAKLNELQARAEEIEKQVAKLEITEITLKEYRARETDWEPTELGRTASGRRRPLTPVEECEVAEYELLQLAEQIVDICGLEPPEPPDDEPPYALDRLFSKRKLNAILGSRTARVWVTDDEGNRKLGWRKVTASDELNELWPAVADIDPEVEAETEAENEDEAETPVAEPVTFTEEELLAVCIGGKNGLEGMVVTRWAKLMSPKEIAIDISRRANKYSLSPDDVARIFNRVYDRLYYRKELERLEANVEAFANTVSKRITGKELAV